MQIHYCIGILISALAAQVLFAIEDLSTSTPTPSTWSSTPSPVAVTEPVARVDFVDSETTYDTHHWSSSENWTGTEEDVDDVYSVLLTLTGTGLGGDTWVGFTSQPASGGSLCSSDSMWRNTFKVAPHGDSGAVARLRMKFSASQVSSTFLYLCLQRTAPTSDQPQWVHQGENVPVRIKPAHFNGDKGFSLTGVRAEGPRVYILTDGTVSLPANQETTLRLFGQDFQRGRKILLAFTRTGRAKGSGCDDLPITVVQTVLREEIINDRVISLTVTLPEIQNGDFFFLCIKDSAESKSRWIHQGEDPWLRIFSEGRIIPKWIQIWLIVILQIMSGLFSGLNLGLMALDKTELKIISKCGTQREKDYAKTIAPLRSRGNYLLCSIVLGNVLVNSLLTVMLDDLTSGLVAVIGSTVGIVIFGEIIPQAICSRHGLAVGAATAWITKIFMVLTFPMSYPISKILDLCLGEEIGNLYDRERLMEYVRVIEDYNKLEKEEVNMISGALELKRKCALDIMTPVEDVYMISDEAVLDFETVAEVLRQGYTRVPVYEGSRNNVVALLHTKDLALVDPDDNLALKGLCQFYKHPIIFVFGDEKLDTMLNEFKKGKSHLACVRAVRNSGEGDPFYEIKGIVTLEDIIEEIIQAEIMDETDTLTDNRRKQRRKGAQIIQDFSDFVKIGSGKSIISPQLALATFQFLSTSVDPFRKTFISEAVLRRLLTQNIFFSLKHRSKNGGPCFPGAGGSPDSSQAVVTLFKYGKPADYFLLILEGRVKVTVGKEKLMYEAGPFTYFGVPAIAVPLPPGEVTFLSSTPRGSQPKNSFSGSGLGSGMQVPNSSPVTPVLTYPIGCSPFVPDYSVVAASDVIYMKVQKTVYASALKATLLERHHRSDASIEDCFQECRRSDCNTPCKMLAPEGSPIVLPVAGEPLCEPQDGGDVSTAQYLLTGGAASISAFNTSN